MRLKSHEDPSVSIGRSAPGSLMAGQEDEEIRWACCCHGDAPTGPPSQIFMIAADVF